MHPEITQDIRGMRLFFRSFSTPGGIPSQKRISAQRLDEILNKESGLLGISGVSGDMREILAAVKSGHERAQLAFDIYIHRLQSGIGAMVAVLGGIDALIFTAGVGENSPEVRAAACANLGYLDLRLDPEKNPSCSSDEDIGAANSAVHVLVIHAQEDWAIATKCWNLHHAARQTHITKAKEESQKIVPPRL